jgi:hypothetical protein
VQQPPTQSLLAMAALVDLDQATEQEQRKVEILYLVQ